MTLRRRIRKMVQDEHLLQEKQEKVASDSHEHQSAAIESELAQSKSQEAVVASLGSRSSTW